jgi:hypothetical protein
MTIALMFVGMVALILLNVPIAISLGVVAMAAMVWSGGLDALLNAAIVMYGGATSFPLLAIPLFILAGAIMNSSSLSRRGPSVRHRRPERLGQLRLRPQLPRPAGDGAGAARSRAESGAVDRQPRLEQPAHGGRRPDVPVPRQREPGAGDGHAHPRGV